MPDLNPGYGAERENGFRFFEKPAMLIAFQLRLLIRIQQESGSRRAGSLFVVLRWAFKTNEVISSHGPVSLLHNGHFPV